MSVDRTEGRRRNHRAFRPTLDGGLETRQLLSKLPGIVFLNHPKPGVAYKFQQPPFRNGSKAEPFPITVRKARTPAATEVAHGGQTAIVSVAPAPGQPPAGAGQFAIQLTYYNQPTPTGATATTQSPIQGQTPGSPPVQPQGTVRAYPMPGGKVGIIVDGSTNQTELTISPYAKFQRKGYAHSFSYGMTNQNRVVNIGQITINSGQIGAIEGYHSADLSGPLVVSGTTPVDRIAFDALLPGASIQIGSIQTGGDLNTLDVLKGVNLNSGPGIVVGRDLNLINVGQDLDLSNGASLFVGRFLGNTPQPPKGTANGSNFLSLNQSLVGTGTSTIVPSLAGFIQGNFNIKTGSSITVISGISNSSISINPTTGLPQGTPSVLLVNGSVNATSPPSPINIPNLMPSTTISTGANFVARNNFFINGVPFTPLTANLVSSTATSAVFNGTASPGATVTYSDSNSTIPPKTTTANNLGNYSITVSLATGSNIFTVTSTDVFGRTVTTQTQSVGVIPFSANFVSATASPTTPSALFTGTANPGATITYTNVALLTTTTTTANILGNYSINVPLTNPPLTTNMFSATDGTTTIVLPPVTTP